jgi:hypothetical protein
MLINLSNHSVKTWLCSQLKQAEKEYGEVLDLPFPNVPASADRSEIKALAVEYTELVKNILQTAKGERNAVHLMGEFTFTYALVNMLKKMNISAVASTTERSVIDKPDDEEHVLKEIQALINSIIKAIRMRSSLALLN